jgi:hypothetical protein
MWLCLATIIFSTLLYRRYFLLGRVQNSPHCPRHPFSRR